MADGKNRPVSFRGRAIIGTAARISRTGSGRSVRRRDQETARRGQTLPTILELIAEIADTLCRGLTGIEEDIVQKSLQETLFHCVGLELDLSVAEGQRNFQTFLDQRGSTGFIRLFLALHLFNVIWIERQDAIQAAPRNEQRLHQLMNEIERFNLVTVNASMVSWKKWPELSVEFADSLLDAMNVRMREAVGAYSGAA